MKKDITITYEQYDSLVKLAKAVDQCRDGLIRGCRCDASVGVQCEDCYMDMSLGAVRREGLLGGSKETLDPIAYCSCKRFPNRGRYDPDAHEKGCKAAHLLKGNQMCSCGIVMRDHGWADNCGGTRVPDETEEERVATEMNEWHNRRSEIDPCDCDVCMPNKPDRGR